MLPAQHFCQKRTPVYVQATSEVVKARASEPLPSAISFIPGIKIIRPKTDLTVDFTGVLPEGVNFEVYRNLKELGFLIGENIGSHRS